VTQNGVIALYGIYLNQALQALIMQANIEATRTLSLSVIDCAGAHL
jgi:hypothetical protein